MTEYGLLRRPMPLKGHQRLSRGDRLLVSAAELAHLLGISRSTVWSWHASGEIPLPLRIRGATRWRRAEIARWVEAGCPGRQRWNAMKGTVDAGGALKRRRGRHG